MVSEKNRGKENMGKKTNRGKRVISLLIRTLQKLSGLEEQVEAAPILNVSDQTSIFNTFAILYSQQHPVVRVNRHKPTERPTGIVILNVSDDTSEWNKMALELARQEREQASKECLSNT